MTALTSACIAPVRRQRLAVVTAAKRGSGGGSQHKQKKKAQRSEAEQFEQLMEDWDDAFAADCADPETAAQLAGLAEEGYRKHGRGFVFVQSRLERRTRKAAGGAGGGKGFGATAIKEQSESAGAPLPNNPQLVLHEWSAVYIPGGLLGSVGGVFSSAGEGASLSLLPDNQALLAQDGGSGSSAAAAAAAADPAAADAGAAEDAAALDELRRVLRGQDLSQLYAYIGLSVPGAEGSSSSDSSGGGGEPCGSTEQQQRQQEQEAEEQQAAAQAGIRAYEPEAGELVVLLAARISGKPATGAELFVAVRQPDGSTRLELPDGWEALLAGA